MKYQEFIYYNKNIKAEKNDFYGVNSPLSYESQKGFLQAYTDNHKKCFGYNSLYEKAVTPKMLSEGIEKVKRNKLCFSAYKRKQQSAYKGWQLYTDRATIQENTILLQDDYTFPVPCAKYEFYNGIKRLVFSVKIDKGYFYKSNEGILPVTTARWFELRSGCTELIKLAFTTDGQIIVKDGRKKPYHYELNKVGEYSFNEWFTIEMSFNEDSFSLKYNRRIMQFPYNRVAIPNTVFFSGGMQPASKWEIKPVLFKNQKDESVDLFEPYEEFVQEEYIGEVTLPYVLGTEKNKDEVLILKRKFLAKKDFVYTLELGALDPSGNVFVNGKLVLHTDNFQPYYLDITKYVQEGENELVLEINSRAPEVLYPWHRHNDYYNGWFALETYIHEYKFSKKSELFTYLKKIGEKSDIVVEWDTGLQQDNFIYRISLMKVYPDIQEERIFVQKQMKGKIKDVISLDIDLWSVETPNLYRVLVEILDGDTIVLSSEVETGFRLVEQKNGAIYINGKKTVLKGALNMQFLPPYDEIPLNHVCPSDEQIVEQVLAIKSMNGNCMRMHQLGYGCNDKRFACICDRLGILLIWTTRLIDSAENMKWTKDWKQKELYQEQMRYVLSHPSIIIWEGSNELHTNRKNLDRVYDIFVDAVLETDKTRLLSPVSHLYYGGGIYDFGCEYYNTTGEYDEWMRPAKSSYGWKNDKVVRSAHTYDILLGYGSPWSDMVEQKWQLQPELFEDKQKAYLVSEYAIIGRQNPNTKEANEFINKDSYELPNEAAALGQCFMDDEWELSQAFQALCTDVATKQLLRYDADGMIWCCLWGGANNASYLKPIIDFYGYKKMAYYSLKQAFEETVCFNQKPDVLWYSGYEIVPMLCGLEIGQAYKVSIQVTDINGIISCKKEYPLFTAKTDREKLLAWKPNFSDNGYYRILYEVQKV